ncbi:YfcC family protein [Sulfitobacter sabulilitoris]|uniref:YfcC family protein n=1 Tax=Sulfitobacter sabulilitoris TaxID=2562655 RepID=A0A5S3PIQ5_9RHOB|nr:YfcC family protein [Sulfitobacter sabulilitoris]TMM54197.1 YfcC family protein [Sulfitobacter sabulilitoris]
MTGKAGPTDSTEPDPRSRFPTAYTILFLLIIFVAALTWIIPAGQYDRVLNADVGCEVAVPGTFRGVEATPQRPADVLLAPIAGFYDPDSYKANAIDVALFVLFLGGFLGVVNATGSIDAGIGAAMRSMAGHEIWMIPILMTLFALGGTTYGMAEETLAFYAVLLPVVLRAGCDAVTGVAVILIGAGIGVLGSTINPFATIIASNAASIAFTVGMALRLGLLIGGLAICIAYVTLYARRVKADNARSVVSGQWAAHRRHLLEDDDEDGDGGRALRGLTGAQKTILVVFAATFAVMIWGVSSQGWWMARMGALFLAAAIAVGLIGRLGEKRLTDAFVHGARDLLGVALVIGLARGIVVIMENGLIADTILNASAQILGDVSDAAFIVTIFAIEAGMSFLVPSSSGLAVLTMPILAPLADFAGVGRDLVVTAYQSANGLVNLVNPTFAVVIGGLTIGRVPYDRWIVFIWPLLAILTGFIIGALGLAAWFGTGGAA